MAGILGDFGELVWRHFWEAREPIVELIRLAVWGETEFDDPPQQPLYSEYVTQVVGPMFKDRLGHVPLDRDLLERFAQFLRAAMAVEGEQKFAFDYAIEMHLLYLIDDAPAAAAMREVDPELVTMVQQRYGVWLDR
ncbi:hypothetical protein [Actinoplanes sp. NPDC051411]|uniref:hypothetical protein n=1 Tax=Actinoplanes sp. NPDC051411 TaxID=3155522 RepID=UPI0034337BA8